MSHDLPTACLQALEGRRLANAGYVFRPGGEYRPDATAWAILACQAGGATAADLQAARTRLQQDQLSDGRLPMSSQHPEAFWPTSLAVLAWSLAPEFQIPLSRAVQFLLDTTGRHPKTADQAVIAHDPSIRGWPWIQQTHSWVMPTAVGVLALKAAHHPRHERTLEAVRLLLDRQITDGGWNYGNTKVYGQKLHPMAECTGVALTALAGSVAGNEVENSRAYLSARLRQVRTPLALSWGLLGLAAWGARPAECLVWLNECWRRQERYGAYDTVSLALMLLALVASGSATGPGAVFPGAGIERGEKG